MNSAPATVAIPGYLVGTWKADPVHSEIAFSVRHLMVSKARGRFTSHDVTIVTSEDPLGSSVTASIDLASIDTGNEPRDNHLRSADYFEVEKYPTKSYRSTGIRQTDAGWVIDGELTLRRRHPAGAAGRRGERVRPGPVRRAAGRLLRDRADQPARLRHRHHHPDGRRWRGRRQGVDQPRDRGRPPEVTRPGRAAPLHPAGRTQLRLDQGVDDESVSGRRDRDDWKTARPAGSPSTDGTVEPR